MVLMYLRNLEASSSRDWAGPAHGWSCMRHWGPCERQNTGNEELGGVGRGSDGAKAALADTTSAIGRLMASREARESPAPKLREPCPFTATLDSVIPLPIKKEKVHYLLWFSTDRNLGIWASCRGQFWYSEHHNVRTSPCWEEVLRYFLSTGRWAIPPGC
jgi:hypothetical protein